jgi:hypothetical protein
LRPFINVFQGGFFWHAPSYRSQDSGPRYLITRAEWADYRAWQRGAYIRDFDPLGVRKKILRPGHVQSMLEGLKYYHNSGRDGFGLPAFDIDQHEPEWQDDLDETVEQVTDLLGPANVFTSASDRGAHTYLKIDYRGHTVTEFNQALRRLEKVVKQLTATRKCVVELKGTAGDRGSNGTLVRLPCGKGWDERRLQEFIDTPVLTYDWLLERCLRLEQRLAGRPPVKAPVPHRKRRVKVGSHFGTNVPPEEMAQLPDMLRCYKDHAFYLYAYHVPPTRKDVKITATDCAIFLALTSIARKYVRQPGQTPSAFIKLLWQQAYRDQLVDRAWCDNRYSALWKTAADCQVISVEDDHYWVTTAWERGQCMKWELKQEFCYESREDGEDRRNVITTGVPGYHPGVYRPTRLPPPPKPGTFTMTTEMEAQLEATLCFWT